MGSEGVSTLRATSRLDMMSAPIKTKRYQIIKNILRGHNIAGEQHVNMLMDKSEMIAVTTSPTSNSCDEKEVVKATQMIIRNNQLRRNLENFTLNVNSFIMGFFTNYARSYFLPSKYFIN
jgi:hypothetical protein